MRTILIEWRHLDIAGATCRRCYDTGVELVQAIARLWPVMRVQNLMSIVLKETTLHSEEIDYSI
jgi:hypothetical protein